MPNYLRAYANRDAAKAGKAGDPIRFTASTESVARDGLIIEANGWQLDNYRNNPVFLWAHDYMGARPPIGKADPNVVDGALMADVTFDQGDEFARDIERKYREGFLSTVSVGWDTLSYAPAQGPNQAPRITKAELLDISGVPVPGDPGALMERQVRALRALAAELPFDKYEPPLATAGADWRQAQTEMIRLFLADAQTSESKRRAQYNGLARTYRKLGKTPPEYRAAADLRVLGPKELAGLFLADESADVPVELLATLYQDANLRAGAVLSGRNRDDLAQAVTLVQGVLERAKKEEAAPADGGANAAEGEGQRDAADAQLREFHDALMKIKL